MPGSDALRLFAAYLNTLCWNCRNLSKNDSNDLADLQSNGKQNQTANSLWRKEAVVYVRLLRLEGLEIARNESARQGYPDGAQTPRGLDRRRVSCRGAEMEVKEKKKPNQK